MKKRKQLPFNIAFEDNHLLIVDKPSGITVQVDKTEDQPLENMVKAYIKEEYNKPGDVFLGVVHRIDRPVSGLVIFAKTSKALVRMNEQFKSKEVKKTYWALVEGRVPEDEGKLINHLQKSESQNKSFISEKAKKGTSLSELDYKMLKAYTNFTLLEIKPITGRHHQIRAQLSGIKCPIRGDVKYGARRGNKDKSINLHAKELEFTHPVTKEYIKIIAPLPKGDTWNVVAESL